MTSLKKFMTCWIAGIAIVMLSIMMLVPIQLATMPNQSNTSTGRAVDTVLCLKQTPSGRLANGTFIYDNAPQLISEGHNIITNIGEQMHRNLLGFNNVTSYGSVINISLGNATVAQTLKKLTVECTANGFTRKAADTVSAYIGTGAGADNSDYYYNATATFTETTAEQRINAAGIHWILTSDTDNNMYAAYQLTGGPSSYTIFNVGDKCIIIWLHDMADN